MESWLINNFTFQNVMLVCVALYLFFPKIKALILKEKKMDDTDEDLTTRMEQVESKIKMIEKKVNSDFYRLEAIENQTRDSLEERGILMRSTLAILKGLQEIGANGPTKEAQLEIEAYLTDKAHRK